LLIITPLVDEGRGNKGETGSNLCGFEARAGGNQWAECKNGRD